MIYSALGKSKTEQTIATNGCFDAPSAPLMQVLGCLTIEQLIELEAVKVAHKALHIEATPHIKELCFKLSDIQSKELHNSSTGLYIPRLRTSVGQKSFGYRGVRLWNNLVDEAKEATTFLVFKRILC